MQLAKKGEEKPEEKKKEKRRRREGRRRRKFSAPTSWQASRPRHSEEDHGEELLGDCLCWE